MTDKIAMVSYLVVAFLLIQTFTCFSGAVASETRISMSPSFLTASVGGNITITMNASNVVNLFGWQAAVKYNASVINCTTVWLPEDNVFAGRSILPVAPILNDETIDGLNYMLWGVSLFSGSVSFAQGILFKMNFTVLGYGETAIQIGTLQDKIQYGNPYFPETWYTFLLGSELDEVPFIEQNGNVVVPAANAQVIFDQTGVGSDFAGAVVTVDGANYTKTSMPLFFIWNIGSNHTFVYQSPLTVTTNAKRYFWNSTSGPVPLQNGNLTVSTAQNVTGNYKTQYYLTVVSSHGSPVPASGWWDSESNITQSVSSPVSGSNGTRYECTGWTGNGSVPASGEELNATFTITQPSSIVWNWKTQHVLTVSASPEDLNPQPSILPLGEPVSAESWWYDSAVNVTLTAGTVENWTFIFWKIDDVPQDQGVDAITVAMASAHTAVAYYASSNTVTEIAILNLTVSKTIICQGHSAVINVSVDNKGVNAESLNLTVYANTTTIASLAFVLEGGDSAGIKVTWNTTSSFMIGNYIISAFAQPLPNETDTSDNTFTNGIIYVGILGDINGDGRVDMKDIGRVATRFMMSISDLLWDPNVDINSDGIVNSAEIEMTAGHFMQH